VINNYNEIEISIPKPPSLNQLYAGKFWTFRHREKEKYFNGLSTALEGHDKWSTDRFAIHLRYNSKFDVDNSVVAVKFLADYLRYNGYVIDDTPKHFLELRITFDAELKKDQYIAKIICYNYNLIQNNNDNDIRATKPSVLHSDLEDISGERGTVRRPTRSKRKPAARPKAGKRDNK
jgi:hypothetical protein